VAPCDIHAPLCFILVDLHLFWLVLVVVGGCGLAEMSLVCAGLMDKWRRWNGEKGREKKKGSGKIEDDVLTLDWQCVVWLIQQLGCGVVVCVYEPTKNVQCSRAEEGRRQSTPSIAHASTTQLPARTWHGQEGHGRKTGR
jgi:hypothetical protein